MSGFDHEVRINNLEKHFNIYKKETDEKIKKLKEEIIKLNNEKEDLIEIKLKKEKEDKIYREFMDRNH